MLRITKCFCFIRNPKYKTTIWILKKVSRNGHSITEIPTIEKRKESHFVYTVVVRTCIVREIIRHEISRNEHPIMETLRRKRKEIHFVSTVVQLRTCILQDIRVFFKRHQGLLDHKIPITPFLCFLRGQNSLRKLVVISKQPIQIFDTVHFYQDMPTPRRPHEESNIQTPDSTCEILYCTVHHIRETVRPSMT